MMQKKDFWRLLMKKDFDKVQIEMDKGLPVDFNFDIDRVALQASYGKTDYETLHFLWTNGAKPLSEYVEEIFTAFENGKSPKEMIAAEEAKKIEAESKVKLDLTVDFAVKKLVVESVFYSFRQMDTTEEEEIELVLKITLEPFKYRDRIIKSTLEFAGFISVETKEKILDVGYKFKENDNIEAASIYIQSVHNPVDLKWLKIEQGSSTDNIEVELFFDFEYENTDYKNQSLRFSYS